MKKIAILIICTFLFANAACEQKVSAPVSTATTRSFDFKGKVVEISDRDKKVIKVAHEEIKGFMAAMTMNFAVRDDANFGKMEPGDQITAKLIYNPNDNRSWLENLVISKAGAPSPK